MIQSTTVHYLRIPTKTLSDYRLNLLGAVGRRSWMDTGSAGVRSALHRTIEFDNLVKVRPSVSVAELIL